MFANWSVRRRLVFITISICLSILLVVSLLSISGVTTVLDAQTQSFLTERNQMIAHALDSQLRTYGTITQTLATTLDSRADPSPSDLWQQSGRMLSQTNGDLERVGVLAPFRDGYQIGLFRRSLSVSPVAPFASIISPETAPDVPWMQAALNQSGVSWHGPHTAYNSNSSRQVISVVTPFHRSNGEPVGLVWLDVPMRVVQRQLDRIIDDQNPIGITANYYLLVDSNGQLVTHNGLPANLPVEPDQFDSLVATIEGDSDHYLATTDPVRANRPTYVAQSSLPGNDWSLISILPANLYDASLTRSALQILLIALVGFGGLGWLIYQFITRVVAQPLKNMALAAREIGSGDMRYQIGYQGRSDEIGQLAGALEDMKGNLATSYDQLSRWSRQLEQRVEERTDELNEARLEAQGTATQLQAVYDASLALVGDYHLGPVLQQLSEQVEGLLETSYCAVWLKTDDGQNLKLVATSAADKQYLNREIDLHQGLAGYALKQGRAIMVDDYPNWAGRLGWVEVDITKALCVPLTIYGIRVGALIAGRDQDAPTFTTTDKNLMTLLANLASPIVRNAQLYNRLDAAVKQAEDANRVKTRFLAGVTHELRTPLNLIINNMDFMRIGTFGDVTDDQRTRLDQTIRSAEHLLFLINDLLDVSKIEAGEMQLFFQPTDLKPVLEDTLDATLALLDPEKPIALIAEIPEKLPQVMMDSRRVRQILLNLLSNAVKFTDEGEVHLRVKPDDKQVRFEVSDTGMGIAQEDIDRIFVAFERSKPAHSIEGTGLGLAITRHLVEAHGSKLTVSSTVGKGSTFAFTMPLEQPAISDKPQPASFVGSAD
jgi:signal transduction histidine kinase/HAMP domain-containing protein